MLAGPSFCLGDVWPGCVRGKSHPRQESSKRRYSQSQAQRRGLPAQSPSLAEQGSDPAASGQPAGPNPQQPLPELGRENLPELVPGSGGASINRPS